jgi:hypothetical protein
LAAPRAASTSLFDASPLQHAIFLLFSGNISEVEAREANLTAERRPQDVSEANISEVEAREANRTAERRPQDVSEANISEVEAREANRTAERRPQDVSWRLVLTYQSS